MSQQPKIVQRWLIFLPPPLGFRLQGKVLLAWTVPIANAALDVGDMYGQIQVQPQRGNLRPYTLQATGQLHNFFGINTTIQFHSDSDNPDAVLTALLSDQDLARLDVAQIVDGVAGQDTWSAAEKPSDFPALSYSKVGSNQAGLYINIDRQVFIFYAGIKQLGRAAILVQRVPGETAEAASWGFALVASLDPDWRFARISESLKIVDDVLTIESASIAIASFAASGTGPVLPNLKLVPNLPDLGRVTEMGTGVTLYAKLKFSTTLFQNVKHMLTALDENSVTLYARFKPKSVDTIFSASLGGFKLFDAVTFDNLTLSYQPSAGKTLKLIGIGAVVIPDAHGADHTFKFSGALLVSEREASFKLEVQEKPAKSTADPTSTQLAHPLGMSGIILRDLRLLISYDFVKKTSVLAILADVTIGTTSGFQARILFQNGKPTIVSIALNALPVGQMLLSVLPDVSWPEHFAELTLSGYLYYARERYLDAAAAPAFTYEPGFRAEAGITLHGFAAWIGIAITPGDGIQAAGYLAQPIDWGFLQITGAKPSDGPAIGLVRSRSRTSFTLRAGVTFLETKFGADIQVNKQEFLAKLSAHVETFGDLRLTCAWSKQRGFQIKEWPFELQIPKSIKTLGNILTNLGTCSQLVDKALDLVIPFSGKFGVKAQVSLEDKKILKLVLHCHFYLNAGSSTARLVTVQLQEFTLHFDFNSHGPLTFAKLPDKIFGYVEDNAGPLLESFFTDPVALAKLLTCAGVKYAPKVLIDVLICKGWLKEAAIKFAQTLLQGVINTIIGMAGEVLPYVFGGLGVLIGILSGGLVLVLDALHPKQHRIPEDKVLAQPAGVQLSYADERLTITWQPVKDARDYAYQLTAPDHTVVVSSATYQIDSEGNLVQQPAHLNDPPIIVGGAQLAEGATYTFVVRAVGEQKLGLLSEPATITILQTPASPLITFTDTTLAASWSAVPGATLYDFDLLDSTGAIVLSSHDLRATSVSFNQPPLEPGRSYNGRLRARSAQVVGRWSQQSAITILGKPQNPTLWYADDQLTIGLAALPGAAGYDYQILDDSQIILAGSDLSETSITIEHPPLAAGTRYSVQIRGKATHAIGPWSESAALRVVALEAPANLVTSAAEGRIDVGWQAVPEAATYTAQVLDQTKQLIEQRTEILAPPVSLAQNKIQAGNTYLVRVRAQTSTQAGRWSDCEVEARPPETPEQLARTLFNTGASVVTATLQVKQAFPAITVDELARAIQKAFALQPVFADAIRLTAALRDAGFGAETAALGLNAALNDLDPDDFEETIATVFGDDQAAQMAADLAASGYSLAQTTHLIKQMLGDIGVEELAKAVGKAFALKTLEDAIRLGVVLRDMGFGAVATAQGLYEAMPNLSTDEFEQAIAAVFESS